MPGVFVCAAADPDMEKASAACAGEASGYAVRERGGQVLPPGRPKAKRAPLGGSERHAVRERGGQVYAPSFSEPFIMPAWPGNVQKKL